MPGWKWAVCSKILWKPRFSAINWPYSKNNLKKWNLWNRKMTKKFYSWDKKGCIFRTSWRNVKMSWRHFKSNKTSCKNIRGRLGFWGRNWASCRILRGSSWCLMVSRHCLWSSWIRREGNFRNVWRLKKGIVRNYKSSYKIRIWNGKGWGWRRRGLWVRLMI